MDPETQLALEGYLLAFRAFATDPERLRNSYFSQDSGRVLTQAASDSPRLPSTGRAIRGTKGVSVNPLSRSADAALERIERLFGDSITAMSARGAGSKAPLSEARAAALAEAFEAFANALKRHRDVFRRIYDAIGLKTYSLEELDERIDGMEETHDNFTFVLFARALVVRGLHELEFDALDPAAFARWDDLALVSARRIDELAQRSVNRYSALAFANGPLCDSVDPFYIGDIPGLAATSLQVRYATDDDLDHAVLGFGYGRRLPAGLHACNTVIEFDLSVPVLGDPDTYLRLYPLAAYIAQTVLDVLRVVTGEDIGISHLVLVRRDFASPSVREDYAWEFHADTAAWRPQRSAYGLSKLAALTQEELAEIRRLLPAHIAGPAVKGYNVAIRRLRDAWERYRPEEPERLLDIAIALEAVLLNDGDEKELRFRLALRAARLIGQGLDDRLATFETVRQLYDMRSKIAHGVSMSDLKPTEREKLKMLQTEAPTILRKLLVQILSGLGPTNLKGEQLRQWWRAVELG